MSQENLDVVLQDIVQRVRELMRDDLHSVILYGSYARGDFDDESDIDIALLVACAREDINRLYLDGIVEIASDTSLQHGCMVNFVSIPYVEYKKWLPALPFYQNIEREGVLLSA